MPNNEKRKVQLEYTNNEKLDYQEKLFTAIATISLLICRLSNI
jgi:hypothetical protein